MIYQMSSKKSTLETSFIVIVEVSSLPGLGMRKK
jgi:hypothetical protein